MKFCYIDESGTGNEPYAIMTGIIVDAQRMHKTKADWKELLEILSDICKRKITEFHTRDFYLGNSPWRDLDGGLRSRIISAIFEWLTKRKHQITFSGVNKKLFNNNIKKDSKLKNLHSIWCFMGLHLILTIQKEFQPPVGKSSIKGNTLFIFDEEVREKTHFAELVKKPPEWTDEYYSRSLDKPRLDQVIDVPYYGDSKDVNLIQLADLIAYFIRRYVEIKERTIPPKYAAEEEKVGLWIKSILKLSLPVPTRYPAVGRDECSELFYKYAPESLRKLGR